MPESKSSLTAATACGQARDGSRIDIAGVVRGRLMQDWDALTEDVNFSYPEAFIASNYDGVSR